MQVRTEIPGDRDALYVLHCLAFETSAEATLVDTLRAEEPRFLSLIAEDQGEVVGNVVFSSARLSGAPDLDVMALGPLAVVPTYQKRGFGSALVRAGLAHCREQGCEAVVVLGHPTYYPRFGFVPSVRHHIDSEYDVPEDVFMIMELEPGSLAGKTGRIQYHEAFRQM